MEIVISEKIGIMLNVGFHSIYIKTHLYYVLKSNSLVSSDFQLQHGLLIRLYF